MKQVTLLLATVFCFPFLGLAQQDFSLIPFWQDSLWGYMDTTKQVIIEPQFQSADFFHNGVASVVTANKSGLIDTNGDYVVRPLYIDLGRYECGTGAYEASKTKNLKFEIYRKEGYSLVYFYDEENNRRTEILDCNGVRFDDEFRIAKQPFTLNGVQVVPFRSTKNNLVGLMDANRNTLIAPKYERFSAIYNNVIVAQKDSLQGLINVNDEVLYPFVADRISSHHGHKDMDNFQIKINGRVGLIDSVGNDILPAKYDYIHFWEEEKHYFLRSGDTCHFLDLNLNPMLTMESEAYVNSSSSKWIVVERNDKKGVYDGNGNELLPVIYEEIKKLTSNLIGIQQNGLWGVLDSTYQTIIEPKYSSISKPKHHNILIVGETGSDKNGIIDYDGQVILSTNYVISSNDPHAIEYSDGNDQYGYLFTHNSLNTGMTYVSPRVRSSYRWDKLNNYFICSKHKVINSDTVVKLGVLDSLGNQVIPFDYDRIRSISTTDQYAVVGIKRVNGRKSVMEYGLYSLENQDLALPIEYAEIKAAYMYGKSVYVAKKDIPNDRNSSIEIINLANQSVEKFAALDAIPYVSGILINFGYHNTVLVNQEGNLLHDPQYKFVDLVWKGQKANSKVILWKVSKDGVIGYASPDGDYYFIE
jgi:hypothetical protein